MADETPKKTKRPTAQKRLIRSEKQRMVNKAFKSRVHTAVRSFAKTVEEKEAGAIEQSVNTVYSLMDKGVKRGVFKQNKANRLKAAFALKARV